MSDDTVIYEYTAQDGVMVPPGVPARSLTARDYERLQPEQRREVKALANMFTPVSKSAATRTQNQIRKDEVAEAKAVADAASDGGDQ